MAIKHAPKSLVSPRPTSKDHGSLCLVPVFFGNLFEFSPFAVSSPVSWTVRIKPPKYYAQDSYIFSNGELRGFPNVSCGFLVWG
mmetsp:Transcript_3718/g.8318  ORF Transcript_3718/g.8318 Transcript_3718/m.8318 type:complete len:84 (+) Transcript_3718:197-448(+)